MFGDTELPLALIMEEILGWEKKPQDNEKDEQKTTDKQKWQRGRECNSRPPIG